MLFSVVAHIGSVPDVAAAAFAFYSVLEVATVASSPGGVCQVAVVDASLREDGMPGQPGLWGASHDAVVNMRRKISAEWRSHF